jgi:signal transduction histidine kinase
MATPGRRLRTIFFSISIILPGLLLVVFALRLIRQDRELAEKRLGEERRAAALEIGRSLLSVLEESKIRASTQIDSPPKPPVVWVAKLRGTEMVLPWEDIQTPGRSPMSLKEKSFRDRLDRAEKAEFAEKNPAKAAGLYKAYLTPALDGSQTAMVRLLLARALLGAGRAEEAKEIDRGLLALPARIQDDFYVPFSFYAAERLVNSPRDQETVLAALASDAIPWPKLSPTAVLLGRDILRHLEKSAEAKIRETASRALIPALEAANIQRQAESLKRDFPSLGLNSDEGIVLYGETPWFVSTQTTTAGERFFVALDAGAALLATPASGTRIVPPQDPDGLPLGPAFSNARLKLPPPRNGGPTARRPDSRFPLYLLIVALALGVMIFGSYLFWRDVRRDLETAEMRSQFVASVSHELKTPLAAIRMFAETLQMGRLRDPEKREEYLETIVNESRRLDRLLANVLDFSKIEQGKQNFRFAKTSLAAILDTAARAMDYPLRQRGFNLRLRFEDGIPDIQADADAVLQAVLNLLDNAMKYSGDAREIDLILEREGQAAAIRVMDRGVGIPESEQRRIFKKFYRLSDPRNAGVTGAGLGLSLAAQIAKAHGGRIDVRSRPGEGSVFSILLPLETKT